MKKKKGANNMLKFEIGKTYSMRSACDHNCIWVYTVISRTKATITIKSDDGKTKTCRISKQISEWRKAEAVLPLGRYSMNPILSADNVA